MLILRINGVFFLDPFFFFNKIIFAKALLIFPSFCKDKVPPEIKVGVSSCTCI